MARRKNLAAKKYTVVGVHLDTQDGYIGWVEGRNANIAVDVAKRQANNDHFHPIAVFPGWMEEEEFD